MVRVQPQAVSYILMDCLWKSLYFICGRIKSEAIFALGGSYLRIRGGILLSRHELGGALQVDGTYLMISCTNREGASVDWIKW